MTHDEIPKYKFIGESNIFIKNGDVVNSHPVTWSIKKVNSDEREIINILYAGSFMGQEGRFNIDQFIKQ